jgi:FixJ family two-component response regulator
VSSYKRPISRSFTRAPVVAIVDDDTSVRLAVRRLVCAAGMKAVEYASGEDLIRDFRDERARMDCIVLDLHMMGMNGLQVAEWLTQFGARIPLIFISGADDDALQALGGPPDLPWIRKPFDDAVLLPAIEAAMKLSSITRLRDPL